MSPTIRVPGAGAYLFRFFSSDIEEPPHIHVYRGEKKVKIWLNSFEVEWNQGFRATELNKILKIVRENESVLLEAWHDYFNKA